MPRPNCLAFERQEVFLACSRAWANTGNRIAARIAIMAITTRSSIKVNPLLLGRGVRIMSLLLLFLVSLGVRVHRPDAVKYVSPGEHNKHQLDIYFQIASCSYLRPGSGGSCRMT